MHSVLAIQNSFSKLTGQPPGIRSLVAHSGRGPGPGRARPGRLQEGAGEGLGAPQVLRLRLLGRRRGGRLAPLLPLQELAVSRQAELPGKPPPPLQRISHNKWQELEIYEVTLDSQVMDEYSMIYGVASGTALYLLPWLAIIVAMLFIQGGVVECQLYTVPDTVTICEFSFMFLNNFLKGVMISPS